MRTKTYAAWAALLTFLWLLTAGESALAVPGASIAYVAQKEGEAKAQTRGSAPRTLQRFSPLFAGDVLTIPAGSKVVARFVSTGQTQTYTPTDPPEKLRVMLPSGPSNDAKSRLLRAVFDDQRAGLAKASRNTQAAVRALGANEPLKPMLPRNTTLLRDLTFTWRAAQSESVQITLKDSGDNKIWQANDVKGNHIAYPADAPVLQPGATYSWTISRPDTSISEVERFTLATANVEADMARRLDMLKTVEFADDEEKAITIAAMLIKAELYANALQALTPLSETSASPLVHVLRFQAYRLLSLPDKAVDEQHILINMGQLTDAKKAVPGTITALWMQANSSPE